MMLRRFYFGMAAAFLPIVAFTSDNTRTVKALVASHQDTVLSAPRDGRIAELPLRPGEAFKAGALLIRMDCDVLHASAREGRAELRAAEAQLAADAQLARFDAGSKLNVALSQARVEKASAALARIHTEASKCDVKAPWDGFVVDSPGKAHQTVTAGAPILSVIDNQLRVLVNVPSAWVSWVKVGASFEVGIDETSSRHPATVTRVGAAVDAASQTLPVWGDVATGDRLKPGMSGLAFFRVPASDPPAAAAAR